MYRNATLLMTLLLSTGVWVNACEENTHAPVKEQDAHDHADIQIMNAYLKIQETLAGDSLEGLPDLAKSMATATQDTLPAISEKANKLSKVNDLKAARVIFKGLSADLIQAVESGKITVKNIHKAYCPMAQSAWLQANKQVNNPYYGSSMLKCGAIEKSY